MLRPFASARRAGLSLRLQHAAAAAVTRRSRHGDPSSPEEALTPAEALEAYTLSAARAAGTDAECGSLVPGKRADLLVLSANPLQAGGEAIAGIQVLETWAGGGTVLEHDLTSWQVMC